MRSVRRSGRFGVASVAVLAAAAMAACGSSNNSSSAGASTPAASTSAAAGGSTAASASSFYSGKTLKIIVPYGPGGGYDQWARLIAPYMQKYLGAAKVEVVNAPGGGGLIGTGQIYHAAPDGLTIGDTNAGGDVFDQIGHRSSFTLNVNKFNWIGRPDNDPHVIATHLNGPLQSFDALIKSKSTVAALATGKGSSDYNAAVIVYNAFKVPFKMVAAFSGSSAEKAAFVSGEGTTTSVSASSIKHIAKSAKVVLVVSSNPFSKLASVPTVVQEAQKHGVSGQNLKALQALGGVMDLGHAFIAPPGVSASKLTALRSAFAKALNDPAFQASATKAGLYLGYESASALQSAATKALGQGSLFVNLLKVP